MLLASFLAVSILRLDNKFNLLPKFHARKTDVPAFYDLPRHRLNFQWLLTLGIIKHLSIRKSTLVVTVDFLSSFSHHVLTIFDNLLHNTFILSEIYYFKIFCFAHINQYWLIILNL